MDKDNTMAASGIDASSDVDVITIDSSDTISFGDTISDYSSITFNNGNTLSIPSMGNYTISTGGTGSSFFTTSGFNGTAWPSDTDSSLHVKGDANFEGDIKLKGVSLSETLEKINRRLAILQPDPAKLEHFEALKKAYEHYKTLEALCELPTEDKE